MLVQLTWVAQPSFLINFEPSDFSAVRFFVWKSQCLSNHLPLTPAINMQNNQVQGFKQLLFSKICLFVIYNYNLVFGYVYV